MIDLASMVLAPTAVKDGKVYNAIPNDQDFTFSRGTEATRVNSAGLIEKARTNYLYYSQDFSNSNWVLQNNATITHNITDPNGGTTASRLTFDALTNSGLYQQQLTNFGTGLIRTASIYLKGAVGGENVMIGDASNRTRVVLTTDWVRYEGFASDDSTFFIIYTDHISGASSDTIDIAFAQYENGLVATDVITTTTSSVTVGITDDLPRVDYSGGGCPSLLLEGSRTNINTQSEYFGSSSWNKARMSITDNALTSPEGVQNGANFVEDSTSNSHPLYDTFTVSSGTSYTVSMFVKKGSRDYFRFNAATSSTITFFNLANGTVHSGTGVIEDFGNGWYRCSMTFTAASTSEEIYIEPSINGSSANYQGDGSVSMSIYGFQLEAGSYSTSYIPSYGTSTSRSADSCSLTNASNLIGQSEGTLFVEFEIDRTPSETARVCILSNGTSNERIGISLGNSGLIYAFVVDGGSTTAEIISRDNTSGTYKVAFAYANNDFVFYNNSTQVGTDTSGTVSSCNQIELGNQFNASYLGGGVKQAILFPTRLTNDQLAELTK